MLIKIPFNTTWDDHGATGKNLFFFQQREDENEAYTFVTDSTVSCMKYGVWLRCLSKRA